MYEQGEFEGCAREIVVEDCVDFFISTIIYSPDEGERAGDEWEHADRGERIRVHHGVEVDELDGNILRDDFSAVEWDNGVHALLLFFCLFLVHFIHNFEFYEGFQVQKSKNDGQNAEEAGHQAEAKFIA